MIAKLIAVALLPLYTRHLTRADYGAAEVLLTTVVALSIVVRLGIIEALLRFYFQYEDRDERDDVVRSSFAFLLLTSSVGAIIAAAFAGPLSEFVLGQRDTELMLIAVGGLWVFTNYELLMALFRLDERSGAYFAASLTNVLFTVALTVWLVVLEDEGRAGYWSATSPEPPSSSWGFSSCTGNAWPSFRHQGCCARCCVSGSRRCPLSCPCMR